MSPDAALFARLVALDPLPAGTADPPWMDAGDAAEAATRLAASVREVTALIREASSCAAAVLEGRRGAADRLAAVLARAELATEVQAVRTAALLGKPR